MQSPSPTPADWPSPAQAWYVVGILVVAYAFAILDRIAIGLLVAPIQTDLNLSDTQMGLLQGAAFGISYSLFAIPLGYLADHHSRRTLLAAGICLWSIATMACASVRDFGWFFAARIGVGLGEASVSPTASSLIADYFPPEKRGRAYGIFMLGSTLGIGLAYLIGAVVLKLTDIVGTLGWSVTSVMKSWQLVFLMIGVPGLLLSILMLVTVREPVRREKLLVATRFSFAPLVAALARNRFAYLAVIGGTVFNLICIYAQLAWLPTFFIRQHGWTASEVSIAFGLAVLPIGVSSSFIAGWLLSWWRSRGRQDAPLLVMIGHAAFLSLFGTLICIAPNARLAYVAFMFVTIPAAWSYAAALAALNEITPNEMRGQITGLYTLVTGLVSMGVGAFLVGFLSDTVFRGANGIGPSLTVVNLAASVISAAILLVGRAAYCAAVDRAVWLTGRPA